MNSSTRSKIRRSSTAIVILLLLIMPQRFETIRFGTFAKGETLSEFSENPSLSISSKLQLNKNDRIKLAPLFEKHTIGSAYFYGSGDKIWGEYNEQGTIYFFIAVNVAGTDHAYLYSYDGSAAPTLRKDFGAGLPEQIIFSKDHIIVQFLSDATGDLEWYWSKTPTVSGSWTNIVAMDNKTMLDWARVDSRIYATVQNGSLTTKKADLYISDDDGETWTLHQSTAPVQLLVESSGFLYGYTAKGALRVMENNTWRLVDRSIGYGTLHDIGGLLRLYGFDKVIREFDGLSIRKTRTIPISERPYYVGETNTGSFFKYLNSSNEYVVYFVDRDGVLMAFASFASMPDPNQLKGLLRSTGDVYFALTNDDNAGTVSIHSNYAGKYEGAGNMETENVDKGEIIPKQLIVKHDPLPASTSVKVYYQFNKSGSYTLVLTSDTDGAVKKAYTFTAGTKIDLAKFKVQLETTDATKTPENISLEFLFVPVGITNAK
jgi:hypothetical protein